MTENPFSLVPRRSYSFVDATDTRPPYIVDVEIQTLEVQLARNLLESGGDNSIITWSKKIQLLLSAETTLFLVLTQPFPG